MRRGLAFILIFALALGFAVLASAAAVAAPSPFTVTPLLGDVSAFEGIELRESAAIARHFAWDTAQSLVPAEGSVSARWTLGKTFYPNAFDAGDGRARVMADLTPEYRFPGREPRESDGALARGAYAALCERCGGGSEMLGSFSGADMDAYLPLKLYIGAESVDCTELFRVPLPDSVTVGAVYSAGSAMGMSSLGVSLGGLAGTLDIASAGALAADGYWYFALTLTLEGETAATGLWRAPCGADGLPGLEGAEKLSDLSLPGLFQMEAAPGGELLCFSSEAFGEVRLDVLAAGSFERTQGMTLFSADEYDWGVAPQGLVYCHFSPSGAAFWLYNGEAAAFDVENGRYVKRIEAMARPAGRPDWLGLWAESVYDCFYDGGRLYSLSLCSGDGTLAYALCAFGADGLEAAVRLDMSDGGHGYADGCMLFDWTAALLAADLEA